MSAFESLRNAFFKAASGSGTFADPWVPAVGSDQTTPGTTDLITPRYQRPMPLTGSFDLATGYSVQQNMGGLITVPTTLVSTKVQLKRLWWTTDAGTLTTAGIVAAFCYSALPTMALADAAAPTFNTADRGKLFYFDNVSAIANIIANFAVYRTGSGNLAAPAGFTTDASGNFYIAFIANGTHAYTTPGKFVWNAEIGY